MPCVLWVTGTILIVFLVTVMCVGVKQRCVIKESAAAKKKLVCVFARYSIMIKYWPIKIFIMFLIMAVYCRGERKIKSKETFGNLLKQQELRSIIKALLQKTKISYSLCHYIKKEKLTPNNFIWHFWWKRKGNQYNLCQFHLK